MYLICFFLFFFFFSSRRRHTRLTCDWSSDVCSSDLDEPRFAMGLIGSSGKGGATLHRRNWGEAVESLTGGEYYWMAGNYMKYGASDAAFGARTANDLPVDSHELIALCAPRLTFISYGV